MRISHLDVRPVEGWVDNFSLLGIELCALSLGTAVLMMVYQGESQGTFMVEWSKDDFTSSCIEIGLLHVTWDDIFSLYSAVLIYDSRVPRVDTLPLSFVYDTYPWLTLHLHAKETFSFFGSSPSIYTIGIHILAWADHYNCLRIDVESFALGCNSGSGPRISYGCNFGKMQVSVSQG